MRLLSACAIAPRCRQIHRCSGLMTSIPSTWYILAIQASIFEFHHALSELVPRVPSACVTLIFFGRRALCSITSSNAAAESHPSSCKWIPNSHSSSILSHIFALPGKSLENLIQKRKRMASTTCVCLVIPVVSHRTNFRHHHSYAAMRESTKNSRHF